MELKSYLRILARRWKIAVLFTMIGLAAGVFVAQTSEKRYQATTTLFVATSGSTLSQLSQGNSFAQGRIQSYLQLANSPKVTDAVVDATEGLTLNSAQLAGMITATAASDQVLIDLTVTDTSPTRAAQIANAVGTEFARVVEEVETVPVSAVPTATDSTGADDPGSGVLQAGTSPVKLTVVRSAVPPSAPFAPNRELDIALGLLIGLGIGLILAIIRDAMDTSVRTLDDIEAISPIPVLGSVGLDKRATSHPIAMRNDLHDARSEAYRQLRTSLQYIGVDDHPRVIAVASAMPGEGKTLTCLNLGAALAEAGYRVCVVEADLRRPTIATRLGLVSSAGLTTVLIGQAEVEDVLQNAGKNLAVLTAGPIPPNPSELLVSDQARSVIESLAERVDFVLIDTAPLVPVADGAEIALLADATIQVIRSGKTTKSQLKKSLDILDQVGRPPVGFILNMTTGSRGSSYSYYYGAEGAPPPSKVHDGDDPSEDAGNAGEESRAVDREGEHSRVGRR